MTMRTGVVSGHYFLRLACRGGKKLKIPHLIFEVLRSKKKKIPVVTSFISQMDPAFLSVGNPQHLQSGWKTELAKTNFGEEKCLIGEG